MTYCVLLSPFIMFAPRLFTASSLRTVLSVNRCVRNFSLPAHLVVNMPSLSPTMQTGTIGKWNCKVGDKIAPGDSMADVETDKASMTFEAQDDFYIAKLLVESGAEVKVGDPILVTVEDPSFVSAFANFTASNAPAAPVSAPAPVVEAPKPAAPTPSAPKAAPAPAPVAQPTPAPAPAAPKAAAPAPVAAPSANSFLWGQGAKKSALAKKLSADQAAYIKKYGKSSQNPL